MAYADDKKLIAATRTAAKAYGVAAEWSKGKSLSVENDFLFEMHLLFQLLAEFEATGKYRIEYIQGAVGKKHAFPKKPANKSGRPYFRVTRRSTGEPVCHVCAGTKVADKYGDERGLDVSLQDPLASDSPKHTDVLAMMDAKYKKDPKSRISHGEYAGFHHWVEVFELRKPTSPRLLQDSELEGNCLVTNGQPSTEDLAGIRDGWVVEISNFYPGRDPGEAALTGSSRRHPHHRGSKFFYPGAPHQKFPRYLG